MFKVMVQQQGVKAAILQSSTIVFQRKKNTSFGMHRRCGESIFGWLQHMVEVEGGMFKCVPER